MGANAKNILLVEDSKSQAFHIKNLLERNNYTVKVIDDGKQALKYILSNGDAIDMILLDYHLPSLNGIEILEKLEAIQKYPVVFITTDSNVETAVMAMRAGALDFLPKSKNYINYLPDVIEKAYRTYTSIQESDRILDGIKEKDFIEQMINGIHDPFFVRNKDSKYLAVNDAYCDLFENCQDIIGKSPYDLFPKKTASEMVATDKQILDKKTTIEVEDMVKKNGKEIYYSTKKSGVTSPSGDEFIVGTIRDITKLKNAEEVLRNKNAELRDRNKKIKNLNKTLEKTKNRLKSILSLAPVGIAVLRNRVLTYVNQEFLNITGFTKATLLKTNTRKLYINKEEYQRVGDAIFPAVFEKGSVTLQTQWVTTQGQIKDILLNVTTMNKEEMSGELNVVAMDITQRLEAEREVIESRKKYLNLYNNSPDLYVSLEPIKLEVLECNNTLLSYTGFDRNKIIGKSFFQLIHPDHINKARILFDELQQNGTTQNNELILKTKHGIHLSVNLKFSSIIGNEGELLYYVVSLRDITEKKIVDSILRKKEKEFKALVEHTPDIIARFNSKLKFIYVNPAIEKEIGVSPKNIIGRTNKEVNLPSHTAKKIEDTLLRVFKTGEEQNVEITIPLSDKKLITLYSRIVPEFSEEGKVETVLSITRDISDYKCIQKELLNAKTKAEEADKLKSAFLANMSHEIRTPMNAIIGFSELLATKNISPQQRDQYIHLIQGSGSNLLRLIDDIIDIAKIEAGELTIRKTECHLGLLMQEIYSLYDEIISANSRNRIKFYVSLPDSAKNDIIICDPARLKQVLSNLLTNALKFTDEGKIEMGYKFISKETVEFFVKDTGIGIPEEYLAIIFDRFRQIDNTLSRKHGGTGLGLTISKNMVKLLDGEIKVTSEVDKGSVFRFTIPVGEKAVSKSKSPDKSQNKVHVTPNWENKVILIAEDEDTNFAFLKEVLFRTNASLLRAKTGKEAIELFKKNSIDLILMDIKMPEMNGLVATKEIRRKSINVPIIAQTAYAMEEDKEKCLKVGCTDYITKPIKQQSLLSALSKYI